EYIVVTSVNRDGRPDGGASHFAAAIRALKRESPRTSVEVLIPDFKGVERDLEVGDRSEEHTSELQSLTNLVCRLLLAKKKKADVRELAGDGGRISFHNANQPQLPHRLHRAIRPRHVSHSATPIRHHTSHRREHTTLDS